MKWEPLVVLPTIGWCFSTWHSLSYLDWVEFYVHCVYREQHKSYTVSSAEDEWGENTYRKVYEVEITKRQAEEKRDTK